MHPARGGGQDWNADTNTHASPSVVMRTVGDEGWVLWIQRCNPAPTPRCNTQSSGRYHHGICNAEAIFLDSPERSNIRLLSLQLMNKHSLP